MNKKYSKNKNNKAQNFKRLFFLNIFLTKFDANDKCEPKNHGDDLIILIKKIKFIIIKYCVFLNKFLIERFGNNLQLNKIGLV